MKETLKRDLNKTYLILSSEGKTYKESYELEMIVKNSPESILPLHVLRVDQELQLFYDISSKQTLGNCAERVKMSGETIRALFRAIDGLKEEIRDYLLNMESVVLDLDHIYVQEGKFWFCYCPWEKQEILKAFRSMLEEILGNLDYHDTEGVELAYHLYQSACQGNFSIAQILEEHGEKVFPEKEETALPYIPLEEAEFQKQSFTDTEKQEEPKEEKRKPGILQRIVHFFMKKEEPETEKDFFCLQEAHKMFTYEDRREESYTQVFQPVTGETVLLSNMPSGQWKLRPLLPGYEEFSIIGESFLIGKKRDSIDGYIGRDTISRIHSRLVVRQGHLFIADANSTNGTFVNGKAIEPGKDVEIFPGDRILFADVEYECYNSL